MTVSHRHLPLIVLFALPGLIHTPEQPLHALGVHNVTGVKMEHGINQSSSALHRPRAPQSQPQG
jgi:hypothetical protein